MERNYRKKWGEIDIIAEFRGTVHFVEVKTVSYGTKDRYVSRDRFISHETWLPEENVEGRKLDRLLRTVETWLLEHKYDGEWQIDVASVWIDMEGKRGKIKMLENIIKDT